MFRFVRAPDTGEATYFLLCDHPQCMDARRGSAQVANVEEHNLSKRTFIKTAIGEGWWVDLEGTYCPRHAREMLHAAREAEERGKQVIAPVGPEQILAFGKRRPS